MTFRRRWIGIGVLGGLVLIGSVRDAADQSLWRGLVVAPEQRCAPYDRDTYPYPQSVEDALIEDIGGILSPYTCERFVSKGETDIEHIVALSEAHDSGLCGANAATRWQFARDPLNLTLANPAVNRYQKGAKDGAEWSPDRNACWFAARSVAVRQKYGLTIDQSEADALDRILDRCLSTVMHCEDAGPSGVLVSAQTVEEALADLRVRAEQGDAEAQFDLGLMYANGEGVPEDAAEAVRWYRLAAAQGHAGAQVNLGLNYANGRGVPQDAAEAVRWYRLAAAQGHATAQFNLGVRYDTGQGVPQGYAEAARWYRLAAAQGDATAQFNLGHMSEDGMGVPQDAAEAVRWYWLAAAQGDAAAQHNLGLSYANGLGVQQDNVSAHMWLNLATAQSTGEERERRAEARDAVADRMTREDLSEAQRRAREWAPE